MRVSLDTFGGLAGGLRSRPRTVDSAELSEADGQTLRRLVSAATGGPPPAGVADAQTYEITIEDGGRTTVLRATDGAVPPAFAELRNWLRAH